MTRNGERGEKAEERKMIEQLLSPLQNEMLKSSAINYRKIPKISPGAYVFQRPFLRGLFLVGLTFGGVYL